MVAADRVAHHTESARASPHPDSASIDQVEAAFRWWRARSPEVGVAGARTSALTGGGAVAIIEREFRVRHGNRPALLQPSATYALYAALGALGVGRGDKVLLPALDWTASRDAVLALGAVPVPVAVDPDTLTISPDAAARARTAGTVAVVACHLHGVTADVPALRQTLRGLPIVEDCAAALGSTLDGSPVGTFGDFAAFSFGPGKVIDAGEGGMLVAANDELRRKAIALTAHPLRQVLAGLDPPDSNSGISNNGSSNSGISIRPHWVMPILALHQLAHWDTPEALREHRGTAAIVGPHGVVVGLGERRENAQRLIPVSLGGAPHATRHRVDVLERPVATSARRTGAGVLAEPGTELHAETDELRRSVRLVSRVEAGAIPRKSS